MTKKGLSIKQQVDIWEMKSWVPIGWVKFKMDIKSGEKLKRDILIPNKEELEAFVVFPKKRGEHWKFHRSLMQKWIDEYSCSRRLP